MVVWQRSNPVAIWWGTRGGARAPSGVVPAVSDVGYGDTAGAGSGPRGERPCSTRVGAAGSALVRLGYTAVAGSMLVFLLDAGMVGFPLWSLLAAVLYLGYVVVYWSATYTRRTEAAALGVAAGGLAVLYLSAGVWQ